MEAEEFKKEYAALLNSGELYDYFPAFTGDWDKDGKYYISAMVGKNSILDLKKDKDEK